MSKMADREVMSTEWTPLTKGAKTVKVELRSGSPVILHVARNTPTDVDAPAFTLSRFSRRVTLPSLNKNDIVYGRAKRPGTKSRLTLLIDRGQFL